MLAGTPLCLSLQDQGGFYDRGKLFWKGIEDMTIMAACAPPGGGRQDMSSRFTRHMHTLCMPPTSEVCLLSHHPCMPCTAQNHQIYAVSA